MANDTVTLVLDGEVPLDLFVEAVRRFDGLVRALARESGADKATWIVTNLDASSALATARGQSNGAVTDAQIEEVVRKYLAVGKALQEREPLAFSSPVQKEAIALTQVLNGAVSAIRFETAEDDATVRASTEKPSPLGETIVSYGAVEGRVQALSSRGGLRFTLYDTLHDRAVSCYMASGHEDEMRDIWGRRTVIEGRLTRDRESGRPLAVREITAVTVLREVEPSAYQGLRGLSPGGGLSAEAAIRRLRNAG